MINQQLTQILTNPERPLASIAAVAFQDQVLLYEGYFGHSFIDPDDSANNVPTTSATKFRVASISKLVATIGVMQLVERGKLALDADVSDILGFSLRNPHYPARLITLAMLLSHTSSIRDSDGHGGDLYTLPLSRTISEFFDPDNVYYAGGAHWGKAGQEPGKYFTYCNLNFGLVGTVIEAASGQRFDQYMREQIFAPLGIDASYNVDDFGADSSESVATLYRKQSSNGRWDPEGVWVPQMDNLRAKKSKPTHETSALAAYTIGTNGTLFSPQGGLRISASDLALIGMLICNEGEVNGVRLLRAESVPRLLAERWSYDGVNGDTYGGLMRAWGLSAQLIVDASCPADGDRLVENVARKWVGHAGDAYGLHSGLWLDPASGLGIVYIVGGIGADPALHGGAYSSFYRWEEEIATALYGACV